MADDLREREPLRDQGDNPPEEGIRSDIGGTSRGGSVAPGGAAVERADDEMEPASDAGTSGTGGRANPLSDVEHPTADE